jgi:hypothetical protein
VGRWPATSRAHEPRLLPSGVTQAQRLRLVGSFPMPLSLKGDRRPIPPSWDDVQTFLTKANCSIARCNSCLKREPAW